MKLNTKDLTPLQLNIAVALLENLDIHEVREQVLFIRKKDFSGPLACVPYQPTEDATQAMPFLNHLLDAGFILQKADYNLGYKTFRVLGDEMIWGYGPNALTASVRGYLVLCRGETVDIPDAFLTLSAASEVAVL